MTRYAYDPDAGTLVAVWDTGIGARATTVTRLPSDVDGHAVDHLCEELTELSATLWQRYVLRPLLDDSEAEVEADQVETFVSTDTSHHSPVREALAVLRPRPDTISSISDLALEEVADRVEACLSELNSTAVDKAVLAEIAIEVEAFEQAELGNLVDRAAQALVLDRADASPVQVDAADRILHSDLTSPEELFTTIDPAAACVAAAHWLASAASVAAKVSELEPSDVFEEADELQPGSVVVPDVVVAAIVEDSLRPEDVVLSLIREALLARAGEVPDLPALLRQVELAEAEAQKYEKPYSEEIQAALMPERTTILDPLRPARDLLEHLLDGIQSSLVLYAHHTQGDPEDPAVERAFLELVRTEAAAHRDRLV